MLLYLKHFMTIDGITHIVSVRCTTFNNNKIIQGICIAFLLFWWKLKALTVKGGTSLTTTNESHPWVMHQSAPERSPHTGLRWRVRELMNQTIIQGDD